MLLQEGRFNKDYCKMRYIDNHDFGSAFELVKDKNKLYIIINCDFFQQN